MKPLAGDVRRYFDTHADEYDQRMGRVEKSLLGPQREWATSRASGQVLELAVGTGLNLPLYPLQVEHVIGLELSAAMLSHARSRRETLARPDRIDLRQGDVQQLDLPDACVDTVMSTYSFCTIPDPGAALAEAWRVLRPGGRLVLVEHGPARSSVLHLVQRLLDPLSVRWQADHLLRDPRPSVTAAGFRITDSDQVGFGGLVHRVDARKPGP